MDWLLYIADYIDGTLPELVEVLIFGFAFFFLERINPAEKDIGFFKSDMKNEFFLVLVNIFLFIPIFALIATLFVELTLKQLFPEQLFDEQIQSMPLALQILIGSIVLDFSTYWRHRFTHYYMWSYHSIHHSAKNLTWLTGLRLHPIDIFAGFIFTYTILYFAGFSGAGFFGSVVFIKAMNYFTHMNLDLKFGKPMRYLLASPAFHRWHHANQKEAYDTNFCGAFPFLDLMFGTYYHPEHPPEKYGLSPGEQKNFPEFGYMGWLTYPLKRDYRLWKRWRNKKSASKDS